MRRERRNTEETLRESETEKDRETRAERERPTENQGAKSESEGGRREHETDQAELQQRRHWLVGLETPH